MNLKKKIKEVYRGKCPPSAMKSWKKVTTLIKTKKTLGNIKR